MLRVNRLYRILFHCFVWSTLVCGILLLGPRSSPDTRQLPLTNIQVLWSLIPCICLFYLHAYWLMPYYLFRRKRVLYWMMAVLTVALVAWLSSLAFYLSDHPPGHFYHQAFMRRTMACLFFMLASACVRAFGENARLEKARKEKETDHLRTELSFLRGQVNPHFMLNVLNSMVLMARKKSESLEPALLELAGLMNYILYEADHEKIRLEDELEFLRVYIDLQMLRFKDDVVVQFNIPSYIGDQHIEPMLLIPMVENAFKHGIGLVETPLIHIDVAVTENNVLSVTVQNKFNHQVAAEEKKPAGIGLMNLKKRLDLIYPESHRLEMTRNYISGEATTENWFIISLNIPLQ